MFMRKEKMEVRFFFKVIVRLDTDTEIEYYRNGGILHKVLRDML